VAPRELLLHEAAGLQAGQGLDHLRDRGQKRSENASRTIHQDF
jgi:hypothetical protein